MSVSRNLVLAIKMLLERGQYTAELNQAVADTQDAARKIEGSTKGIDGAVQKAVQGQSAVVRSAAGALTALGPIAGAVVAGAAAVGAAYHQAHKETLAYEKAIILTGNAAGVTSGQLADMARRMDGVAGSQAQAAAALASMTASGQVARENLEKVSLAAVEMERATGQAIGDTEKIFSSLGREPVKASLRLNESMNYLTASTYAQIKAADELGDKEGAVSIAQNAAADALRSRAAQVEQHLGLLERAWRGVRDVAKEAWDQMLNVGRPDTLTTQIVNVRQKIEQARGNDANRRFRTPWDTPLSELEQQLAHLTEQERLIRRGTEAQAERNRVQSAGMAAVDALGKANDRALSRQERAAKELDAYRDSLKALRAAYEQSPSDALAKLLDPTTIAKAEAAIIKSGQERVRTSNAAQKELEREAALVANLSGVNADYMEQLTRLQKVRDKGNISEERYIELVTQLISKQPMAKKLMDEQTASTKAAEKATLELAKERDKAIAKEAQALEKLQASVTAQNEQNARLGLTKEAITELDAAKLDMLATDSELQAIKALDKNLDEQQYDILKKQAQAYRDLAKAKRDGAARQVELDRDKELEKTADKAAKEGERAAETIERSLTDSLMRGFEAGKDMLRSLGDSAVAMFKTMVLRPVISAIVSPVAGAATAMLGLGGGGAGQSGGGSAGSMAMSAASLFGAGGMAGSLAAGAGWLTGATTLGGSLSAGMSLLGTGTAAGAASGLGMLAGALGPIAIGIALLSSLIKKSTPHMGGASSYSASSGAATIDGRTIGTAAIKEDKAANKLTADLAKTMVTILDSTAKTFGKEAGYSVSTAIADDKSKDGAWGALVIEQMGKTVLNWQDTQASKWAPKVFSDGEAGSKEYLAAVAKSARDALVGAIGDVDWATDMLTALGDSPTLEGLAQTVQQINAAQAAFESFGKNIVGFAGYTDEAISALVKAAGSLEGIVAAASSYYENFYTDAERAANVTRDVTAALADVGLEMPKTRDEFRALVESQMALGESGAPAVAALLGVSGAFASITQAADAAEQASKASLSGAFGVLQRAVDAEKRLLDTRIDLARETSDTLDGLFGLLRDNVRELYGEVASTAAMQAAQGSAFIAQALSAARTTGYLPEQGALAEAIGAARSGIGATQYATQFEADRARLVLAGQLSELEGMAGEQLGTAERALKELRAQSDQLDATLQYWRDQIELSQAGVDATLSVADAVAKLQALMFPDAEKPDDPAGSGGGGFVIGGGGGGGGGGAPAKPGSGFYGAGGTEINDAATVSTLRTINSSINALDWTDGSSKVASTAALGAEAAANGWSASLIAISAGMSVDDIAAMFPNIPKYAVGTNYVPRDMLAQIHEGEAIVPKAYNPWAGGGAGVSGNTARLEALVEVLTQRVESLQSELSAIRGNTGGLPQLVDQFDNVTGGGNAMRNKPVGATA